MGAHHDGTAEQSEIVQLAMVLRDELSLPLLAELFGISRPDALRVLADLEEAEIVEPSTTVGVYRFSEQVVREASLASLRADEAADLHRRVLDAIEAIHGTRPDTAHRRAQHAVAALPLISVERAVTTLMELADLDESALRHARAADWLQQALDIVAVHGGGDGLELELRVRNALCHAAVGTPDADRLLHQCFEQAVDAGDIDVMTRAALALTHHVGAIGITPLPDVSSQDALALVLHVGGNDDAVVARAASQLSYSLHGRRGARPEIDELLERAATAAARADDERLVTEVELARAFALFGPGRSSEQHTMASRAAQVAGDDHELRLAGLGLQVCALMEEGRFREVERAIDSFEANHESLPLLARWTVMRWRAAVALAIGELDHAETAMTDAMNLAAGTRYAEAAELYFGIQAFTLARERDQLAELAPLVDDWITHYPNYNGFEATRAFLASQIGDLDEAAVQLDRLRDLDFDTELSPTDWLPTISLLGYAAGEVGDADIGARCLSHLAPFAEEWMLIGTGTVATGPVAMFAGMAAVGCGDLERALELFDRTIRLSRRAGSAVFLHHGEYLLARVLLARGHADDAARARELAERAAAGFEAIGMGAMAKRPAALRDDPADGPSSAAPPGREEATVGVFRPSGSLWELGLAAEVALFNDLKGLRMLRVLIERPHVEVHALELSAAVDGVATERAAIGQTTAEGLGTGGADEILDPEALAAYRRAVQDLQHEIDEAEHDNDPERRARAQEQLDLVVDELAAATGLGGRSRQHEHSAERARVRVTKAIRTAIDRVDEHTPQLGAHLRTAITTGTFCSYRPEERSAPTWQL